MMTRSLAALLITIIFPCLLFGQGEVRGRVIDIMTGKPVAGAYVLYGKQSGTTTNEEGYYSFSADSGACIVTFQFIGYKTLTKKIVIREGHTSFLDAALSEESQELDQVVVSADRSAQKLSELTVSLDVIRPSFLEGSHITDAQELINKSPGIEVLDGQASIRGGSGFSYGVGSRVLAMVEGLPLLSPDAGGIRWQYLPSDNFSQIEIIKGASSVLYGSSALNGIINFRLADAGNIPETRFFTETGIYTNPRRYAWKWWSSPRIFGSGSVSHLRRIGNTDIGGGLFLMAENSYRKYNDDRLGRISFRLKQRSQKVQGLVYGLSFTGALNTKTDFILWEDADSGALKQDTSTVSLLNARFMTIDPYIRFDRKGRFRHDFRMRVQASGNHFPVKVNNNASSLSVYSEYLLYFKIAESMSLTAGLSENWNRITSNFFGDHTGINLAGFSQIDYRPVERLKFIAGVRLEQSILDSEADKIVPVFRTGMNLQLSEYTFLRASFGQGYRFPSIAEKYASTTLGSVRIFPNPLVEAESGWSTEAGIKQGIRIGKFTGQADLALFFSQNKNLIEYVFASYPDGLGFRADNIEFSRIYGAESELIFSRESQNMKSTLMMGYTYIYPVEYDSYTGKNTDIFLKYRRNHSARISLVNSRKRVDTDISIYFRSRMLNIDDVFLISDPVTGSEILPGFIDYWSENNKGYFLMDLSAGYRITSSLKLSIAVKNLTNTEYMGRPGDIQPVRNISLRLAGDF